MSNLKLISIRKHIGFYDFAKFKREMRVHTRISTKVSVLAGNSIGRGVSIHFREFLWLTEKYIR